jgi:hypothetical protein
MACLLLLYNEVNDTTIIALSSPLYNAPEPSEVKKPTMFIPGT